MRITTENNVEYSSTAKPKQKSIYSIKQSSYSKARQMIYDQADAEQDALNT